MRLLIEIRYMPPDGPSQDADDGLSDAAAYICRDARSIAALA